MPLEPPLPLPELPVPLLEPPDDPPTCWPTVRFTSATNPAMGEVSVAAVIACWAAVTWPCADVAAAVSAASYVELVELSALSAATLACAVARVA